MWHLVSLILQEVSGFTNGLCPFESADARRMWACRRRQEIIKSVQAESTGRACAVDRAPCNLVFKIAIGSRRIAIGGRRVALSKPRYLSSAAGAGGALASRRARSRIGATRRCNGEKRDDRQQRWKASATAKAAPFRRREWGKGWRNTLNRLCSRGDANKRRRGGN